MIYDYFGGTSANTFQIGKGGPVLSQVGNTSSLLLPPSVKFDPGTLEAKFLGTDDTGTIGYVPNWQLTNGTPNQLNLGEDLNNLGNSGAFRGIDPTNRPSYSSNIVPSTDRYYLMNFRQDSSEGVQLAITGSTYPQIYLRAKQSDNWGAWQRLSKDYSRLHLDITETLLPSSYDNNNWTAINFTGGASSDPSSSFDSVGSHFSLSTNEPVRVLNNVTLRGSLPSGTLVGIMVGTDTDSTTSMPFYYQEYGSGTGVDPDIESLNYTFINNWPSGTNLKLYGKTDSGSPITLGRLEWKVQILGPSE